MSEATTLTAPVSENLAPRQLVSSRLAQAETARNVWRIVIEEGTLYEEILKPLFWAGVAHYLHRFDKIEVIGDEEIFYAELLVTDCGQGYAAVAEILKVDLGESANKASELNGYSVKWKGPKRRWAVIRDADSALMKDDFATQMAAMQWADDHRKAVGN